MAELTTSTVYGNLTVSGKIVGAINEVNDGDGVKIWVGTTAEYNAIATKDANTLYFVT
jgi:hypothetical protein